jgi:uncharacterized protein YeaO (DUF488 family)
MPVRTKRIYDPPHPDDGRRILVMRYWPRGVRKSAVDEWRKELGTSPTLIRDWKSGAIQWPEFARRYRKEVAGQSDLIRKLAAQAKHETVTLLCGCEDEAHCHRTLLKEMIARSASRARPDE